MFEAAELRRAVAKIDYESEVARLRVDLFDMQRRLERHPFSVIILFGGVDAAGKSETVPILDALDMTCSLPKRSSKSICCANRDV